MTRFVDGEWAPADTRLSAAVGRVDEFGVTVFRRWHPLYGPTALVVFRPGGGRGRATFGTHCRMSFWDFSAAAVARRAAADLRGWLAEPTGNLRIDAAGPLVLADLDRINYEGAQMSGSGWL